MNNIDTSRAWIEINLDNLEHNINEIKKIIPNKTKIMAVVKANAYGHGIVQITKKLNSIGIEDFAVATLSEGIILRQNGIKGNILILGYTSPEDITKVIEYNLIQTLVDYDYACKINSLNLKKALDVHIKINTGMNRIGENLQNIDNIIKMYSMNNFNILGIFSHLCVSDSSKKEDIDFTKKQINTFYSCIDKIKSAGYNVGKIHIQASYGILNYPELNCDYVRPGIIMYGVHSSLNDYVKTSINLKPVLSLKARIETIKEISSGESVGYGRTFIAKTNTKIATIAIGYGDGYPRALSNKDSKVFLNNNFVPIIGRICMDQLVIDISNVDNVKSGDIVTLIGDKYDISAKIVASKANTITHELLCRLGTRLPIIII